MAHSHYSRDRTDLHCPSACGLVLFNPRSIWCTLHHHPLPNSLPPHRLAFQKPNMSHQVRDPYLPFIIAELDVLFHSNTDKATDKDPLLAMAVPVVMVIPVVTVAPVVMVVDLLSHRPPVLLPAPTPSTSYPYLPLSMIVGPKTQVADQRLDFESQAVAMVQHRRHRQIRPHQHHRTSLVTLTPYQPCK